MAISLILKLQKISQDIAVCRVCSDQKIPVIHGAMRFRGHGAKRVMVVGIAPGNTELKGSEAFAGAAGKRLMNWLSQAGLGSQRDEILNSTYLTSIVKCGCDLKNIDRISNNCAPFLRRQIAAIEPQVIVTLGQIPLSKMFGAKLALDDLVGRSFLEYELNPNLYPLLPEGCFIIPLPHPSPLSRWLNQQKNQEKLETALALLGDICK